MSPQPETPDSIVTCLTRIGETPDGKRLAGYLRAKYLEAVPPLGSSVGALREIEAARRIASDLLKALERGKNGERRSPGDTITVGEQSGG